MTSFNPFPMDASGSPSSMQCQRTYNAAGLDVIFRAIDKDYKLIISAVMSKQKKFHEHHPINLYKNIIDRLSIGCSATESVVLLDSTRIIVPLAARQAVIESLHICSGRVSLHLISTY